LDFCNSFSLSDLLVKICGKQRKKERGFASSLMSTIILSCFHQPTLFIYSPYSTYIYHQNFKFTYNVFLTIYMRFTHNPHFHFVELLSSIYEKRKWSTLDGAELTKVTTKNGRKQKIYIWTWSVFIFLEWVVLYSIIL